MKCQSCGQENRDKRRKTCKKCGSPLPRPKEKQPVKDNLLQAPTLAEKKAPLELNRPRATATDSTPISTVSDNLVCSAPNCRYQNRPGMYFCYQCGTPLYQMAELPEAKKTRRELIPVPPPLRKAKLVLADNSEIEITGAGQLIGRENIKRAVPPEKELWISREHFLIYSENDRYYIEDKKSTNDTKLQGRLIKGTGRIELQDGDLIEVSPTDEGPATTCTFRIVT